MSSIATSVTLRRAARVSARAALALVLVAGFQAVRANEPDPAVMTFQLPDNIKWTGRPGGPQTALLAGDPSKEGIYVQLLKWPKGSGSMPHSHPKDRFIYVISGTWYCGSGADYKPETMQAMPAGTYIHHIAKQIHYDGAKDGDVVIELVGEGPANEPRPDAKK